MLSGCRTRQTADNRQRQHDGQTRAGHTNSPYCRRRELCVIETRWVVTTTVRFIMDPWTDHKSSSSSSSSVMTGEWCQYNSLYMYTHTVLSVCSSVTVSAVCTAPRVACYLVSLLGATGAEAGRISSVLWTNERTTTSKGPRGQREW